MATTPLNPDEIEHLAHNVTNQVQNITGVNLTNSTYGGGRGNAAQQLATFDRTEAAAATDAPSVKKTTGLGGNKEKTYAPSSNPLDQYTNYTYGLTLHVLTRDDYNTLVTSPTTFKPSKTLISSAGRYRSTDFVATGPRSFKNTGRDPAFSEDFYFENLSMETVIGQNAHTRGTNAINIKFTIIEPYGMTLMDRLLEINNTGLNGKNYVEMPYLLEINFFGADEKGNSKIIDNQTKWIPIKLLSMKIKAGVKGSEYSIDACPFNHSANLETVQSIKTRMNVTATTVADYFSSDIDDATTKSVDAAIAEDKKRKTPPPKSDTTPNNGQKGVTTQGGAFIYYASPKSTSREPNKKSDSVDQPPIVVNAKSFVAAYNAWFKSQVKNGNIGFADQIKFVFLDDAIRNSKIVDQKKSSVRRVSATGAADTAKANDGKDAKTANFDSVIHDLEAGTRVNDIINLVIPQSEYFLNQAIDSSTTSKTSTGKSSGGDVVQQQATPVKLWKIVPSIELGEFDSERNVWGKTITFYISTYNVYQQRDDRLPKSPPPTPVKRYDYLYTGQNSSVIGFDIEFNALYYTAIDVDRGKTNATTGANSKPEDQQEKNKPDSAANNHQIQPETRHVVANDQSTGAGGAVNRSETINAKSALNSIYTTAGGDMISVRLQILGDPEFIKQDDLFISPAVINKLNNNKANDDPYVPGTRSLAMDTGEICCYLTFRTPTDFSDSSGLYNLDSSKYRVSEFSGFYRVITVNSEFKSGKFVQTLNLVRYPMQDSVNKSKANDSVTSLGDAERKKTTTAEQKANSPRVSKSDLDRAKTTAPDTQTTTATTAPAAASDAAVKLGTATGSDLDAAFSGDIVNNATDKKLAEVAKSAPTLAQTQQNILAAITR